MKKKAIKPRIYVELTAVWGNGDADSTIKISPRRWKQIQDGAEYDASTWSWYEGRRDSVNWHFGKGEFSICGADGTDHIIQLPVEELIVQLTPTD